MDNFVFIVFAVITILVLLMIKIVISISDYRKDKNTPPVDFEYFTAKVGYKWKEENWEKNVEEEENKAVVTYTNKNEFKSDYPVSSFNYGTYTQTKYETVDMSEYLIITYIQYSLTDECMEDKDNIDKEFEEKNQSHKISHFISDNVHIVIEGYNQGFSSYTGKEVVLDRSYDVDSIKDSIVFKN